MAEAAVQIVSSLQTGFVPDAVISLYEGEPIKPAQTWKAVLNLLVRNMQAYSGEAKTRLRRIRRKSDRVSDSTMKEISNKVEPHGDD